jgi:hypothetical protein
MAGSHAVEYHTIGCFLKTGPRNLAGVSARSLGRGQGCTCPEWDSRKLCSSLLLWSCECLGKTRGYVLLGRTEILARPKMEKFHWVPQVSSWDCEKAMCLSAKDYGLRRHHNAKFRIKTSFNKTLSCPEQDRKSCSVTLLSWTLQLFKERWHELDSPHFFLHDVTMNSEITRHE